MHLKLDYILQEIHLELDYIWQENSFDKTNGCVKRADICVGMLPNPRDKVISCNPSNKLISIFSIWKQFI